MARIVSENLKQQIRDANDIADVVGSYVPLKRAGRAFKARCPFHQEKTPSFHVNPELQIYKCFGCGAGGDVFKFVQEMEKVSFPEALAMLAEKAGIALAYDEADRDEAKRWREGKQLLYRMHEFARRFFQEKLASPEGASARAYLDRRGISEAMVERFGIGYAPDSWDALTGALRRKKARPQLLFASGLATARADGGDPYDRFRNRLVFPITDSQGRVIAFGGRALSDEAGGPKYLNSPETPLFGKGRTLYGLHEAREALRSEKRALLMEGYTDVVMCAQHGIENAVATLGTALSRDHVDLLGRHVESLLVVFDADRAGAAAAERGLDLLLAGGLSARVVTLPGELDPCEFLQERGGDAFRAELESGRELFEFKLDRASAGRKEDDAADLARAAREVMETVAAVRDPVARALLRKRAAKRFGVPEKALEIPARRAPRGGPDSTPAPAPPSARSLTERELVRMALHQPEAAALFVEHVESSALEDTACTAAAGEIRRQLAESGRLDLAELLRRLGEGDAGGILTDLVATGARGADRLTVQAQWEKAWREWHKSRLADEMKAIERELAALRGRGDRRGEEALSERKLKVSAEVDRLNREALPGGSAE